MPAKAPPAARMLQGNSSGRTAKRSFTARVLNSTTPIGLPKTKPTKTASAKVASNVPETIGTPAFASAKSGIIAKATQGWRKISRRSIGDKASRAATLARRRSRRPVVSPLPAIAWRISNHAIKNGMQAIVADPAARRRHQPEDHPRERRIDTRRVERKPDAAADREVDRDAPNSKARDPRNDSESHADQRQRDPV